MRRTAPSFICRPRRAIGFGPLVDEASKLPVPDAKSLKLRDPEQFKYIGKVLPLVDAPDIVTGKARFGADINLRGLLYAVVARPPVVGGRLRGSTIAKRSPSQA